MIAQWENECIPLSVLPVARVQLPAVAEYFKWLFPGCSHSANPSWASVAENGSTSPQWHHTTCWNRGGRPKSNHGQTMAKKVFIFLAFSGDEFLERSPKLYCDPPTQSPTQSTGESSGPCETNLRFLLHRFLEFFQFFLVILDFSFLYI